jgi:serine/threonine protein phosphatase PrpC
MFTPCIPLT